MFLRRVLICGLALAVVVGLAAAAPEVEEKGSRFVMTPVEGGFLRMDTRTGAVSMCQRISDKWSCELMADDRRALEQEVERLGTENRELGAAVKRLEDLLAAPDADGKEPRVDKGPKLQLPSEEEVDRALTYLQRLMRKFKEKLRELESDPDRRSL